MPYNFTSDVYDHSSGVYTVTTPDVIDDFERGDIVPYNITAQDGTIATNTAVVFEGLYSLQVDSDGGTSRIQSTSGLPNYPAQGDIFSGRHRFSNLNSLGGIMFGVQSETTSTNFYDFLIAPARDKIRIRKDRSPLNASTVNFSSSDVDEWFDFEVEWDTNGDITGRLRNPNGTVRGTVQTNDTKYSSGGVGFRQNADSLTSVKSYWDDVREGV